MIKTETKTGLRWHLRDATRLSHERLDARFGSLDLTQSDDYGRFLMAHGIALASLHAQLPDSNGNDSLMTRIDAIDSDLSKLGLMRPSGRVPSTNVTALQVWGIRYVVTGSHLGQTLLRRQWAQTTDPVVARAHAYFDLPDAKEQWTEIQDGLNSLSTSEPVAGKVVEGAEIAFRTFADAYDSISEVSF